MPLNAEHPFIGVDWGTSNFRAALIAPDGEILQELADPRGILSFKPGEFAPFLIAACAPLTKAGGQSFVLSGMIGSRDGLLEVPYVPCPASPQDIANGVRWAVPDRVAIAPGVQMMQQDVMRGEETQVFGAAAVLGLQDANFVLPGTHSKWVQLQQGAIVGFDTFMTGECFHILSEHSILKRSMGEKDTPFDRDAFLQGLDYASESQSLLNTAFSLRVKSLFGELNASQASSYLSGLVIGEELMAMQVQAGVQLQLVGSPLLTERYKIALEHFGAEARLLSHQVTWAGLREIYLSLCGL